MLFRILFGVNMKTSLDDNLLKTLQDEVIQQFDDERQEVRNEAKVQILKAQQQYKENFDKKRKVSSNYQVSDLVAVKWTQYAIRRKLGSEFIGPYNFENVNHNNRYEVVKAAYGEGPNEDANSVLSSGTDYYLDPGS